MALSTSKWVANLGSPSCAIAQPLMFVSTLLLRHLAGSNLWEGATWCHPAWPSHPCSSQWSIHQRGQCQQEPRQQLGQQRWWPCQKIVHEHSWCGPLPWTSQWKAIKGVVKLLSLLRNSLTILLLQKQKAAERWKKPMAFQKKKENSTMMAKKLGDKDEENRARIGSEERVSAGQ